MLIPALCAQLLSADTIVARYVAARGGLYRGERHEGQQTLHHATMALLRPYYKLVGDPEHRSPDFSEGYDGSAWEFYGDPGVVVRTVGAASAAGVAGRPAYRLLVHMLDGFEQEERIDATTWLMVAERHAAPIHAFGASVTSEERIGDYRAVDGVLFPYSHREVERATGRVLNELPWTSITVNHTLDPAAFSPPSYARTPFQAFLEKLYAERSDTMGDVASAVILLSLAQRH